MLTSSKGEVNIADYSQVSIMNMAQLDQFWKMMDLTLQKSKV